MKQEALIDTSVASHVADTRRFLHGLRTQSNIARLNEQFELFLRRFKGHPAASWHACTPELVLTYLRTDVAGRGGRSGDALAASTLRQHVSNLSRCFVRRGLTKPWDEVPSAGNTVPSRIVRDHVEVIERRQHASGQRARSATPVSISVVLRILHHLDSSVSRAIKTEAGGHVYIDVGRHLP